MRIIRLYLILFELVNILIFFCGFALIIVDFTLVMVIVVLKRVRNRHTRLPSLIVIYLLILKKDIYLVIK